MSSLFEDHPLSLMRIYLHTRIFNSIGAFMRYSKQALLAFSVVTVNLNASWFDKKEASLGAQDSAYVVCYGSHEGVIYKEWAQGEKSTTALPIQGKWDNGAFRVTSHSRKDLEAICRETLSNLRKGIVPTLGTLPQETKINSDPSLILSSNEPVYIFASLTAIGYEYPIVDKETDIKSFDIATLDKKLILDLAKISYMAYQTTPEMTKKFEKLKAQGKTVIDNTPTGYVEVMRKNYNDTNLNAIAYKKSDSDMVVIAFKGTDFSSLKDVMIDVDIMLQKIVSTGYLSKAMDQAREFYRSVQSKVESSNIVLTGDSMGGYISTLLAVNTGLPARVFSTPATEQNHFNPKDLGLAPSVGAMGLRFRNHMAIPNVINFVRNNDPLISYFGNHKENMVYFEGEGWSTVSPMSRHSIKLFVNYLEKQNSKPTHAYITPDAVIGFGLNHTTSVNGAVKH